MTILMFIIRELWLTKGKVQTFLSWRASVDVNKKPKSRKNKHKKKEKQEMLEFWSNVVSINSWIFQRETSACCPFDVMRLHANPIN